MCNVCAAKLCEVHSESRYNGLFGTSVLIRNIDESVISTCEFYIRYYLVNKFRSREKVRFIDGPLYRWSVISTFLCILFWLTTISVAIFWSLIILRNIWSFAVEFLRGKFGTCSRSSNYYIVAHKKIENRNLGLHLMCYAPIANTNKARNIKYRLFMAIISPLSIIYKTVNTVSDFR